MANNKKIVNQVEYKFSIEGLDREIKRLENLNVVEGEAGKKIRYIITGYKNLKDVIAAYGDNIPVDKLKEMSNIFEKLKRVLNSLSTETELGGIKTEAKDFTKELKELQNQLEEIEKLKQKPAKKVVDAKAMALAEIDKNEILKASIQKRGNPLNSLKAKVNAGNKENATEQDKIIGLEAQKAIKALQEQKEALRKEEVKEQKEYNELLEKEKRIRQEIAKYIKQQKKAEGQGPAIDPGQLAIAKKYIIEQEAAARRAREEAEKTGASVVKISTGVNKVAGSVQNATARVLKFTIVNRAFWKILRESVKTIEEMDESLTGMMVVTGKTREEVEGYVTAIKNVSAATSTAMTDVANLVTEYVRQGRTMKEALLLAEETAKAAKIAGISTRDSIIYMTSAINGFNLAVKDATRVSDIFANLAAVSATNYEQLAIALSKVSAQANMAGMSIEYTTALLAKGIETTQEAPESIGTALKTIIARMRELTDYGKTLEEGTSVNRVESALRSAGIELRTVNGEFRNLEDVFNELGPK